MMRDALISMLTTQLGNRTDLQSNGTIKTYLQFAQEQVLEVDPFVPWFLETSNDALVSVAAQEYIELPSDFIREVEDEPFAIYDATVSAVTGEPWSALKKDDYKWIKENRAGQGEPTLYAIVGDKIMLRYVPDAIYTFRLKYYAKGADLSGNPDLENVWTKHGAAWLMAAAGSLLAGRVLRDTALRSQFDNDAAIARNNLIAQHEARQHAGRQYSMGDD